MSLLCLGIFLVVHEGSTKEIRVLLVSRRRDLALVLNICNVVVEEMPCYVCGLKCQVAG
jgi:hypothetical protein